ncbi:D-hexose-6-phosphate mutarotase [Thaumasiovibrio sp. DFM-14]|uniref:D-hexose-6-phosphate mutarotase n=1 Tax=Thaumasiovibrio sp. DFM-14 TaxID=3384792 RepID=UPI0039A1993C
MHNLHLKPINAISEYITVCDYQGIPVLHITHPLAEAAISLHGGHIIGFKPHGEKGLLWLSEKAEFAPDKAIRGGIPVCWPWFGKATAPAHGFARTSLWSLQEHRENDTGVIVSLSLEDNEETLAIWPHKFHNVLRFEIGNTLTVSLTTTNTDAHPWQYGGALHTYFDVEHINTTTVTGMGEVYLDSLQEGKVCKGELALTFEAETDRIYTQPEPTIVINDTQRQLMVKNGGDRSAVIWNPWMALSTSMADMADNSYETMLCVESTIHGNDVTLAPSESHTLTTKISIG